MALQLCSWPAPAAPQLAVGSSTQQRLPRRTHTPMQCIHHSTPPPCSDAKAKAEKRNPYSRHYAFKGRGRKEHLRGDVKMDRCELVPTRG